MIGRAELDQIRTLATKLSSIFVFLVLRLLVFFASLLSSRFVVKDPGCQGEVGTWL